MKKTLNQWAWRTLLILTCALTSTQAWADTWTVAGSQSVFGSDWSPSDTNNDMTTSDGTHYTWTKQNVGLSSNSSFEFKVVKNHAWGEEYPSSNKKVDISAAGYYDITITFNSSTKDVGVNVVETQVATTWTVAGNNTTLFGSTTWSATNTANDMTDTDDDGIYTWSASGVTLNAGTVEFKVCKNHGWTISYPSDNYSLSIPSNGDYNVTITYNSSNNAVAATADLVQTTPDVYTVAGAMNGDESGEDVLFGTAWDATNSSNDMTLGDGGIYTWHKDKVTLTKGYFKFKVCKNHSWDTAYPAEDYYISLPQDGKYDITITYNSSNNEVTATATFIPDVVYLFGSVGKSEAWLYSDANPTLTPDANYENYTGTWDVNEMPSYTARDGKYGLFLLTTGFGTDWNSTVPYMIGTLSTDKDNHYWIDGGDGDYGEQLDAIVGHTNGWTLPAGTYTFTYNRPGNWLKVEKFDGPVIYVYDYSRPYIYVRDSSNPAKEFNGPQPGAPILNLDETVGGHRGLSSDGDVAKDGASPLGWYKCAVPSKVYPIKCELHHNGDNKVTDSGEITVTADDAANGVYYYWTGSEVTKYAQLTGDDPDSLRRIVAHVRVQGTTVPTCDGKPMNGPSSFYGQMYYWTAVTTYKSGFEFVITDGKGHSYDVNAKSDFYIELGDNGYKKIEVADLNQRFANKTGRGTLIHLLKNDNTPTNKGNYLLGIDTKIHSGNDHNTTNLGATWWGKDLTSQWKGIATWTDPSRIISNYDDSRYIYLADGKNGNPDVFTITSEDGKEWYTWYSDRSTATIKFGYGNTQSGYPTYHEDESTYKFFATYESAQPDQTAGEVWYVWTPDFNATLTDGQSKNNGELIDVTRTYESRAKQKAMCSTFRDGNYVYYTDIKGWGEDSIYCYVWNNNESSLVEWPGVKMSKVGYDDEGHPVYLADLSLYDVSNVAGIIFNDGKNGEATDKRQTGNLEWENHGCYDYLGLLYRIGGNTDVIDNEPNDQPSTLTLTGVWYSRVTGTLFAKGDNDYNNKSINGYGYTDYAKSTDLQSAPYDQSNWVEIQASYKSGGNVTSDDLKGLIDSKFTLYGIKESSVNPLFEAISVSNVSNDSHYDPNHFTPANFMGQYQQCTNGINYFFVEPKPNEFVYLDRGIYVDRDDASQAEPDDYFRFIMNTNTGLKGSFNVDWTYHDIKNTGGYNFDESQLLDGGVAPDLINLTGYSGWLAIIKKNETTTSSAAPSRLKEYVEPFDPAAYDTSVTPSATYTVYPICITSDMATAIQDVKNDKAVRTLKTTRYYNLMGVESSTPFSGVNIVVKEYTDGTRESSKAIMR